MSKLSFAEVLSSYSAVTRSLNLNMKQVPQGMVFQAISLLKQADERYCVRQVTKNRVPSAVKVTECLETDIGKKVGVETVRRALRKAGLGAIEKPKKPLLSAKNIRNRLSWCISHKDWTVDDWKRMTVKHGGSSIMLWSVITYAGVGWMCKINGNMHKKLHKEILEDELERTIKYGVIKEYFQKQSYTVLQWPAQSPDLNPIENMWSLLKRRLYDYETAPKGMNELYERVTKV
ncbi:hypothetical protein G6F66_012731 [Rhizopus arrhizus]|nr:hypothetical protein G6F66_012731 [Rhizopus arrhizus]